MEAHVLIGDALRERFPKQISGQIIVAREAMIDGDKSGQTLEELFDNRSAFFEHVYKVSPDEYAEHTIAEIKKITLLPNNAIVNLWFEDDLFCQTNLWFVSFLIATETSIKEVYLIRPEDDLHYGFGRMDTLALEEAYEKRTFLDIGIIQNLRQMWASYQADAFDQMLHLEKKLNKIFPRLKEAIAAHKDRFPSENSRPKRVLTEIMKELNTREFVPVFKEFNKRESIYGFGDLQVKRLFDEIVGA